MDDECTCTGVDGADLLSVKLAADWARHATDETFTKLTGIDVNE